MAYPNKTIRNPKNGSSITFLQTAKDTGGQLLEMESTYDPHSKEPPPHYHPFQEENFTVLSGALTARIDGYLLILKKGDTLHIPKGKVHSMWNHSDVPATVNWRVQPALDTEYFFETTMGLAADGKTDGQGRPSLLQMALLANRYSHVFRLARPSGLVQKIVFGLLTPVAYLVGYRARYQKYLD